MRNDTQFPGSLYATDLTTHEHVKFPDGSHVIVHSSPGRVQITGMVAGEWIEYAGTARDAEEQARLLETEAPDALWSLPTDKARRIATAMGGAVTAAHNVLEDEQVADGQISDPTLADGRVSNATCPSSERIALDGGHADVDLTGEHVEVTVRIGDRAGLGIALSADEAARIGAALTAAAHRAHVVQAAQIDLAGVETVTDLFRRSQERGIPVSALVEVTR